MKNRGNVSIKWIIQRPAMAQLHFLVSSLIFSGGRFSDRQRLLHPYALRLLCALALVLNTSGNGKCEDDTKWYFGLRSIFKNCPSTPWNPPDQEKFFESFRNCVQRRALTALDSLFMDDVIPVIDGVDLIRFPGDQINTTDDEQKPEPNREYRQDENENKNETTWSAMVIKRLTDLLRTHVVKIDIDHLANSLYSPTNSSTANVGGNIVEGRRRRHRRRHNVMPLMMMGLLLMGSILVPMGFQFLAVLGGKALILAKMALILSSIQGLKKIATNGVNYGLYHTPVAESWHERSHAEAPDHIDLANPIYAAAEPYL